MSRSYFNHLVLYGAHPVPFLCILATTLHTIILQSIMFDFISVAKIHGRNFWYSSFLITLLWSYKVISVKQYVGSTEQTTLICTTIISKCLDILQNEIRCRTSRAVYGPWRGWLRHYATGWEDPASIPRGVLGKFSSDLMLLSAFCSSGVHSTSNRNEYKGISLGAKRGRRVELRALPSKLCRMSRQKSNISYPI